MADNTPKAQAPYPVERDYTNVKEAAQARERLLPRQPCHNPTHPGRSENYEE